MFREFGYASRGCPLFGKFWTMLFHSPLAVAENSKRTFWFEWKVPLRYGKTGDKRHETCFATLLQNELQSDVARFTTLVEPVLHQVRLLTGLNVGGKTCNVAFQLVLQQCCKRSCIFFVARFSVPLVVNTPWCSVARILRTARGLIGYFEVTWHRTIDVKG